MGSQIQADTIIRLMGKVRKLKGPEHAERIRTKVLAATHEEVQAWFADLNALTGFDRKTSPATEKQLSLLATLEKSVYGTSLTWDTRGPLTYEEADSAIKRLKATQDERALLHGPAEGSALDALSQSEIQKMAIEDMFPEIIPANSH